MTTQHELKDRDPTGELATWLVGQHVPLRLGCFEIGLTVTQITRLEHGPVSPIQDAFQAGVDSILAERLGVKA